MISSRSLKFELEKKMFSLKKVVKLKTKVVDDSKKKII